MSGDEGWKKKTSAGIRPDPRSFFETTVVDTPPALKASSLHDLLRAYGPAMTITSLPRTIE